MVGALRSPALAPPGARRRRFLALMMGAPGSPTPAPPRGPPLTFLSIDGGRSGIISYDTSRGPAVDVLLALRAGAPGSPALAPHGGPGSFPRPCPHSRISSTVIGADKQGPPRGSLTGGTHQSAPKNPYSCSKSNPLAAYSRPVPPLPLVPTRRCRSAPPLVITGLAPPLLPPRLPRRLDGMEP
jgi:hypothetical protein